MTDLEKVIKGLECCVGGFPGKDACARCKYQPPEHCGNGAIMDALELLRAQEPRVMTVEEVVGHIVLGHDKKMYFEFDDGEIEELNAKDIAYNDYLCDEDMPTLYEPNLKWLCGKLYDGVIVVEYNIVWRCWTVRPTGEQMEAVKWDA